MNSTEISSEAHALFANQLRAMLDDAIAEMQNAGQARGASANIARLLKECHALAGIDAEIAARLRRLRGEFFARILFAALADEKAIDEIIGGAREAVARIADDRSRRQAREADQKRHAQYLALEQEAARTQPHAIVREAEKLGGKLWVNGDRVLVTSGRVDPRALELVKLRRDDVIKFLTERDRLVAV